MKHNSIITYILLVVVQMVLGNYFHFTPYVTLSILPALLLLLPTKLSVTATMLIAFATGLCVDFLSEGIVGINAFALVPVAFSRDWIYSLIFGKEILERQNDVLSQKFGAVKMLAAIMIMTMIFFIFYIVADGAGTMPLWFYAVKYLLSVVLSALLSCATMEILTPDSRK